MAIYNYIEGYRMIYMVGGIKGGSGKTTIATNLAVTLSVLGREVLLIDADDQESSTDFTSWRNEICNGNAGYTAVQLAGVNVRSDGLLLAKKFDATVIDTGGRDTSSQRAALTIASVALFPFVPRSLDIWTSEKLTRLLEEVRPANPTLRSFSFINRGDHQGTDNEEAAKVLKEITDMEFIDAPIGNRKAFSNAAANGFGIIEVQPTDRKAITEFLKLYNTVTGSKETFETVVARTTNTRESV